MFQIGELANAAYINDTLRFYAKSKWIKEANWKTAWSSNLYRKELVIEE